MLFVRDCLTGGFLRAVSHKSFFPYQVEQQAAPRTEVIMWDRLESPLVNILFTTKLLSLDPLSWDMYCLLTLWPSSSLFPWWQVLYNLISDLYHCRKKLLVPQPLYTHGEIIKAPLLHQRLGPCVCLSLSISHSPRLIPWSTETRLAHSPARASKTLSRSHPVLSPHL